MASTKSKEPKDPKTPRIRKAPSVPVVIPTKPGERYYEFRDWFNCRAYWKGNHNFKGLIATFLTPAQQEKLNNGTFWHIMAMKNFHCSMKLVHCLILSRVFTNNRNSINFKIFGCDVSFNLEDFHIMYDLRITTHNVEKSIKRESKILKRYFGKSKGVTLKDIQEYMMRNQNKNDDVNFKHVCESDEDVVKIMEILIVEFVFFERKHESTVLEEYATIVEDGEACLNYPWGNASYEKLITSMKHALDTKDKNNPTEYTVGEFPYPLYVWFYERFPDIQDKYLKDDDYLDVPQVPRMLRYPYLGEPKFKELHADYFSNNGVN
uniref:DUF1985 domain-containing protein n=1 Tax=Nicotiana tabacum TaxID=4097 RepID=A0A1S3ZZK1_TOBAC|nr:PREDICTED: uncharacterized protein LOC107792130 [Nicotiana tabacum]